VDFGLLFSFRNPVGSPRSFPETYRDRLADVRLAEELGYDTIWLTEHHFFPDGYSPSVMPIAGAVASMTSRVRIGTYLSLTSFNNAIRFAEDVAVVDVLSDGRFEVGLGQGYAPPEFEGFGVHPRERGSRFVEFTDVIRGLWTQDTFSYRGRHYTIDNARMLPKPVQRDPHPPVWVGARAPRAIDRAARNGFHYMGGTGDPEHVRLYDEALVRHGRRPADHHVGQLYWVHIARTDDEAWARASTPFFNAMSVYGQMITSAADFNGDESMADLPSPGEFRARCEAQAAAGEPMLLEPVCGSVDTVGARLERAVADVRTTHLVLDMHLPGIDPAHARESMELFIGELKPVLDR
jgi:alkanesulfonate monooxygenase SsuD/methylene tetrahydromethanopterin reductase-like flavin-dependent oxidoreductase (luciferase family)